MLTASLERGAVACRRHGQSTCGELKTPFFTSMTTSYMLSEVANLYYLRKEESVALSILSLHCGEIPFGFVFLPNTSREDMLVPLIPPAIDNLGQSCIVAESLEFFLWKCRALLLTLTRSRQRIERGWIGVCIRCRCSFGGLRRIVEDGSIEPCSLVE